MPALTRVKADGRCVTGHTQGHARGAGTRHGTGIRTWCGCLQGMDGRWV